ncbi:MBL fold metallo-hydrolase [Paenibacillus flagellatus]|uniref:MBL fold metallo-hydrolase n=1 Tax=Paenibacillus flagellatus TaxID=2211139 RepID=A0A2V5K948_9BACL|nr:MBL fold metallo-hydrolase [Paenibacillus flagellatus]PYI50310.1 MBL fold metallo-hydrolase [Paenibacillus flagellatus]
MEHNMTYGSDYSFIPAVSIGSGTGREVRPDIWCQTVQIVNVLFVGDPGRPDDWVLVDAGMPRSADAIVAAVRERFGSDRRPAAIVLTHGHFDHVGAIIELVRHWEVPVYAHERELPYLTGKLDYPEPDSSVEGGLIAKMSPLFPNESIDLGDRVTALPADGSVPGLPEWRWVHTPGHTPGHVSLFRERDRTLLAGDAFVTVRQDSLYSVLVQEQEISGPPRYLTPDWAAARESVVRLAALKPSVAATGHGVPMAGEPLAEGLSRLAAEFDRIAVPDYGRYVNDVNH